MNQTFLDEVKLATSDEIMDYLNSSPIVRMTDLWYKGFIGSIEFSKEDDCLFGKILGIKDRIVYEGKDLKELMTSFKESVDDYLLT